MKNAIYICGPMRGYPQFNFPAFDDCERRLRGECRVLDVVNPAQLDRNSGVHQESELTRESLGEMIQRDILAIISQCSVICLLPGWEKSSGARVEVALGLFLGLDFIDSQTFRTVKVSLQAGLIRDSILV